MIFQIEWIERKKEDWSVATLKEGIEGGKTFTEVSINKTNKDGSLAFPEFDNLSTGSTINGNLWKHPTKGTYTLYAERPAPKNDGEVVSRNTPARGGFAAGAMATKKENIKEAQENKEHGIKVAAAMRDATLITIALMGGEPHDRADFQGNFTAIKNWYLGEWDKTDKDLEVPF